MKKCFQQLHIKTKCLFFSYNFIGDIVIALIARLDKNMTKKDVYIVYKNINNVIKYFNEIAVVLLENDLEKTKDIINLCQGAILQGGDSYTEFDMDVVDYLYKKNIPTLGICLGMQTMGCYLNGKLEKASGHLDIIHPVYIKNSSIYEDGAIITNSRHKEKIVNTSLKITGINDVIEMIEDPTKNFFVGVQWHPEDMFLTNKDAYVLFEKFFEATKNTSKKC